MATNNDDIKWLYGKFKAKGYNVGTEQEFRSSLANEADRQWYYEKANGMGLNMGSMADFNSMYAPQTATQPTPQTATQTPATQPTKTQPTPQSGQSVITAEAAETARAAQEAVEKARRTALQAARLEEPPKPTAPQPERPKTRISLKDWDTENLYVKIGVDDKEYHVTTKEISDAGGWDAWASQFEGRPMQVLMSSPDNRGEEYVDLDKVSERMQKGWRKSGGILTEDELAQIKARESADNQRRELEDRLNKAQNELKALMGERERYYGEKERRIANAKKSGNAWGAFLETMGGNRPGIAGSATRVHPSVSGSSAYAQLDKDITAKTAEVAALKEALEDYDDRIEAERLNKSGAGWVERLGHAVKAGMKRPSTWTMGVYDASVNKAAKDADTGTQRGRDLLTSRKWSQELLQKAPMPGILYEVGHFGGEVIGDPSTVLTFGAGGVAETVAKRGVTRAVAKATMKGVKKEAAERLANTWGKRFLVETMGKSANFAVFEGVMNARQQAIDGGWYDSDGEFHEGFSWTQVAKAGGRGAVMGAAMGVFGEGVGQLTDLAVKDTGKAVAATTGKRVNAASAGGYVKAGTRALGYGVGKIGEGTIFAADEIYEFQTMPDDEFDKRYADAYGYAAVSDPQKRAEAREKARNSLSWDAWGKSQLTIAFLNVYGAAKHPKAMIRTAYDRLSELGGRDKREHRTFGERLSMMAERSPRNIRVTKEEREELEAKGYGGLKDLFVKDEVKEKREKPVKPEDAENPDNSEENWNQEMLPAEYAERAEPDELGKKRPELDGYSEMRRLMEDRNVSEATRAKLYFMLTGKTLPMSTVMSYRTVDNEDGTQTVESLNAEGGVVTSRKFAGSSLGLMERRHYKGMLDRQIELNTIDVGERYADKAVRLVVMDEVKDAVAGKHRLPAQAVENIYMKHFRGQELSDAEMEIVKDVEEMGKGIEEKYGSLTSEAMRAEVNGKYGVDIDKALRKDVFERSSAENEAVKEYGEKLLTNAERQRKANRMFDEEYASMREEDREERRRAWRMQMEGRLIGVDPEIQAEADRAYEESHKLYDRFEQGDPTAQAEMDAIRLRMEEAYQMCEDAFGSEAEYYMFHVNENPWALVDDPELTVEQKDAVLYYINAKAALDGVMDASNEVADRKRAEVEESVAKRTHKANGVIIPATMKVDDRPVYIVEGDVVMFPDGTAVDVHNSSESVVIMDAQTGEYKFTSPDQILKVSEAVNPQDELDTALSVIEQEQMNIFGDNAVAPEESADGEEPQQGEIAPFAQPAEAEAPATADTEEYDRGYECGLNDTKNFDDVKLNAEIENLRAYPNGLTDFGRGLLEAYEYEQQNRAMEAHSVPEMPESVPNPTETPVSDAEIAPEPVPSAENGQQTALSRIPVGEDGEPQFHAAPDKETAWDALMEVTEGDSNAATEIALSQIKQATSELDALKKKGAPSKKAPKLTGGVMAMRAAQKAADENYQKAVDNYNAQVAEAEARLSAWNDIMAVYNSREAARKAAIRAKMDEANAAAHDAAVAKFEEEQRIKAEKQVEQERIGVHAVNPKIKEKWDTAPKVEGNEDALTLPDGSTISGRYVLTEAGAASPSHDANNGYVPTEGFPIDENGQSVNDRDYFRDKDAQQKVEDMAGNYDNRALQDPVIVSKDGVVLSGNNRTMSGDLAARRGTDKAYVDYLAQFGHKKYGFTPEQVTGMKNPRVVFVPDEALPYDAATFARFNAQEKKSQGKPEAAVKLGKIVPDNVFNVIVNDISRYDRLSDYYADEKAVAQALGALMQAGVINDMQMPELRTGTALSAAGKELIENTLIGKVFQASPDAVRQIISVPTMRQSIVMGLSEIANNRTLARNGYDISEELAKAVDLVARAKNAMPDVYTDGMPVSPFGRMQGLFDDEFGDSRVTDATTLLLADILNSGRPSDLRKILTTYNNEAAQASGGQMDLFSGSIPTKEEILTTVNEHFRNATPKEQQALVDAAIAERKRRAEAEAEQRGRDQESEQTPNDDERRAEPQQPSAVGTELEPLGKDRNDFYEDTPEEAALRARISVGEEWEEEGPAPDKPIYKRKLYVDGKHEVIQTDAPDKNGSYTGSQLTFDGRDYGVLKEIADYIDGKTTCPVCGKKHIPNYKEQDVVCPQCNSDLSVFRQIDQLPDGQAPEVLANIEKMEREILGKSDKPDTAEGYTITPTKYEGKHKTSDVWLVKFNRELTAEEKAAFDTFVRGQLTEGKKTSRGWYDRKQGGYMMRSEEAARQLAEMLGNEEAVADAQPMTANELREAVATAATAEKKPARKPKKAPINRVSLEDVMTDLSTKGETKLSDHAEPVKTEPEQQHEISDDEMKSLADELRDLLGIGDDEGDTNIKFRDPGELTAQERQRIQSAGIRFAMGLIERGTTAFPDYATKMVGLLGDKIRPWLKSFYEGARWTPGYDKYTFTPTEQVATFDVQNFDKKQADPIAQAAMIVEERKASTASAQAQKELTETRNKKRRENDKQTETDTAALAEKAEAVAGEAEVTAQSAGTGKAGRKRILRDLKRVDDTLEEVNDQLALLGYYEAEEVDKDFNEAYGYMRNAEKKAVKDAVKLAKQLVTDLGLGVDKVTGSTTANRGKRKNAVTANIAPAGGDISIRLPLNEGRELYITIGLDPSVTPGDVTYSGDNLQATRIMYRVEWPDEKGHVSFDRMGRNCWADANVTYADLLNGIQREAKEYLPSSTPAEEPAKAEPQEEAYHGTVTLKDGREAVVIAANHVQNIGEEPKLTDYIVGVKGEPGTIKIKPGEIAHAGAPTEEDRVAAFPDPKDKTAVDDWLYNNSASVWKGVDLITRDAMRQAQLIEMVSNRDGRRDLVNQVIADWVDKWISDHFDTFTKEHLNTLKAWTDYGQREIISDTLAERIAKQTTESAPQKTYNGYKIGDEVMWNRYGNGKWEKQRIIDFDAQGHPIFDSFGQSWITEVGDWERIKPVDGVFGEAKRVARVNAEKKAATQSAVDLLRGDKKSKKKSVSSQKKPEVKPEQPIGGLFGGLFDNEPDNERTEVGTGSRETGGQRQQLEPNPQVGGSEPRRETERPAGTAGGGSPRMDSDADRAGGRGLHDVATQPALERLPEKERKNVHNNHVERGTEVAPKTEGARIKANIAAIETMKRLMESGEAAKPADMKKLRAYSGWGGLGSAFTDPATSRQLKGLLGEQDYNEGAEMSRNSAYFTPAYIVDTMWDLARLLGFKGGRMLEGSAGIGNILGLMPQDFAERTNIRAIEKDPTTGAMLRLLYPDSDVDIDGFEKVKLETGGYDLVMTNVPFVPGLKIVDTSGDGDISKRFHTAIHDFCIAKGVRKLRDGGIGIFISTAGSMDATGKLYEWLNTRENADIIGLFRMHRDTFGGTNATTDIILVRKRVNGVKSPLAIDCGLNTGVRVAEYDTGETNKNGDPIIKRLPMSYNRYLVEHPEYVAGEMRFGFEEGDTFRPESKGCYPVKEKDQPSMLQQWVADMAQRIAESPEEVDSTSVVNHREEYVPTYDKVGNEVKTGTIVIDSQGHVCVNYDGTARPLMSTLDKKNPKSEADRIAQFNKNKVKGRTRVQVVQDYNAIKKALNDLLEFQKASDSDEGLQPKLKALNRAFDSFVATYGHLHGNNGLSWLRNDVDYPSVFALETYREEGLDHKPVFGKADIFTRRVVVRPEQPKATTVRDGVTLSIRQNGVLDTRFIAVQLGKSEDEVKREVIEAGLGYENPLTHVMEAAHEYLSGNVREKLHQAETNNEDGRYSPNITALRKVVPHDIPSHFIEFSIGSSWMRPEIFEEYIKEKTGTNVKCTYAGGMWDVDIPRYVREQDKAFGIRSEICDKVITGSELIAAAMTNRTIRVTKTQKDGPNINDPKATSACAAKVDEIRDDFKSWLRGKMQANPELANEIEVTYNDIFNNSAPMTIPDEYVPEYFDGAARSIGGKNIKMRKHQSKAIVRGTMQSLMLAHEVGTGKTFTLITTAMEMRRLGTAKKPMIVVQNATLGQFVASAKALYPDARILSLDDKDRNAEGRKDFYAKIRYNDWDMVVIPQSVLERIPDHPDRERRFIEEAIEEKMEVIEAMSRDREQSKAAAALKKEVEKLNQRLAEIGDADKTTEDEVTGDRIMAPAKGKKKDGKKAAITKENAKTHAEEMLNRATDNTLNFDDLGVDAILVDEAHEYKHLGFATAMQRGVKGVDPSYSKKCQGLYLKVKAVQEKSGGRNVIFATGTPISNTAAEIWTFMRYLLPREVMEGHNIWHFDDFVRNFGSIQQMLEFTTAGSYKENNRFAGYTNLPELARIWAGIADTVLTEEAGEVKKQIPELEGGKPTDIYLPQTNGLRAVLKYVRAQLKAYEEMSGQEKKENSHIPLVMYGIAKAAAIDARLVMPNAPDDPHSKTNEAVRQTLRSLKDSEKYNGTVAIFADNYQRKNKDTGAIEFNLFEDIRDKLIAQGVPAEQIVIMRDGMTDKKKEKIFAQVNAGEVRVILGTTQRLGVGVNIQERLHTLMHIDAPNRPMDYWQRMGRLLRQGNLHKEMGIPVRVIRFGVEDSLDVTAYQRLKTKGAIADAIMHSKALLANNLDNRVLEEEGDEFGNITAELSGSQYAMLLNQAEKELRKLLAAQDQHRQHQMYIHRAEPRLRETIERMQAKTERSDEILALLESNPKEIRINGKTYKSRNELDKVYEAHNKSVAERKKQAQTMDYDKHIKTELTFQVGELLFGLQSDTYRGIVGYGSSGAIDGVIVRQKLVCPQLDIDQEMGDVALKRIINVLFDEVLSGKQERTNREGWVNAKERAEVDLAQILKDKGKPFEHRDRIAELQQKVDEYSEAMQEELKEKEAKYAEMDANIEDATDITFTSEDDEDEDSKGSKSESTGDGNKYRLVAERELLDFLDAQPLKKGYRYSQWANMGVLPPMTAKQNGEWRAPMIFSRWEQSEEGMRKENGKADLVQGNGRTTGDVAYNPYFHIRTSPLNDQFTAAYDRPELLVVEGYYPESEETSGYQAEGAKDSVGLMDWHSGSVNGQLSDDTKVQTMLSRYFKPGRIVPWSEVADLIMERVGNQKITFPINAVPPMLRAELAKRGAKFGDISGSVAEADIPMLNELRDRVNAGEWDAGLEKARAYLDAYESSTEAKEARVADLSARANTPVRIVRTQEEADALPTRRERRAKGWWSAKDDEVVIVLPNNVNVADVDNTFVHEVAGHKGLRAFIGEERFDEFLGEIYDHASNPIRKVIDKMTDRMVSEEADRLRTRKAQAHERAGEDVNANYNTDMAEARVKAEKKREDFRKEATEEYMSDLGGRIGSEGFEKMSRDELTFWGTIKAKVQAFLDKFLQGLKIAKSIRLNDTDLSYILYKSWKNMREKQGKGDVYADAEDAVMRRRTGWDDAMLSESAKVEDANNRFNRELQQQIEGTLPDGHIYQLGNPGTILRSTGVPNLPIQMSATRLRVKATEYGHDFDLAEIRNLVKELQTPMAVFAYGNKGKMQNIIVGIESNGKQFIVGLSLNPIVNGKALEINSVRNVFPKNNAEWLNWISQGKLLYADKQKIQALIDKQRTILADVAYLDLEDVAKVIKTFENPTFYGDEDVKFRDGADYVERNPVMARAMYEKRIQTSMYQMTEAMQDSMRGLMEFYKAVESQGAKRDIEDVSSFENAYISENLMSSKSHAEMEEYEHRILRPLLDIAARVSVDKRGREALIDYMMAKHGLERNAYMRNEAIANGEESERDFAGLCGLTGEADWQDAEVAAQQIVNDYEGAHSADIAELWNAVNTATKASLKKVYDCGLLSKEQYEKIRDMYDYYIPLRGFDEKTSDDVYGYLTSKGGAFSSPIKKAEGRKSKADDPLATIAYMAQNSIIQGNRNVMKQKFLTYVQNHPSDLASVNRLWLVHDETMDAWKPVFADVDENMTPDEIDKAVMDFEQRMEALSQSEPDKYKRGRDAIGIPYRIVDGNIKEHQVLVKRNGESYVITINGNPRAAQAVNGLTNPDNDLNGAVGKVFNLASVVNRWLAQVYTTLNPDFSVANFIRDLIYSNTMVHVKENQGYAVKFHKNHAKVNPIRMVRLLHLYEANRLNMRNPIHRMFYEFMHWGGETGYTMQRDLEQEKKLVAKIMKEARRGTLNPMSILSLVGNKLDQINRGVENSARFAAFVTSRETGRDVQRSAYDAKEISVNFNKKGSGSKFMDATGQTAAGKTAGFTSGLGRSFYVFWNAAVQGTANYGKAFKKNPVKAMTVTTALLLLGYVMAALMDDGDDEDKNGYYNMPKYTRRSNLMFRTGEQWVTIPLPVEYRALYGLGELAYSVTSGREEYSDAELAKETASQLSQLLPLDFMEGGGGLHAFVPSAFKPIVESATNTSWTGLPLYKDTPFNKDMPEWTKAYPRTSSQLVDLSKWANEASGGNDYKAGWANFNPSQLEYLLNGYFGGYSNVINKMVKTGETMLGERDYDPSSILLVNRLVKMGDERTAEKKINSDFFQYLEDYKRTHTLLRKYEDEAERGSDKYRIFLDALKHSRDGARHDVMDEYIADYNWLNKTIKDPEITDEERTIYEEEMRRLKREAVSLMKVAPDSLQMNRLREQFAQEHAQQ